MPVFEKRSEMPVSASELFAWHERPGAFQRLSPPWESIRVLEQTGGVRDGGRLAMEIAKGPVRVRWVARHVDYLPGEQFCDEQVEGPYARWRHVHRVESRGTNTSVLHDRIEYALPLGMPGRWLGDAATRKMLQRLLQHRHDRTRMDLERHKQFADRPRMTVAITGASGMIGTQLAAFLEGGGHRVVRVSRRKPAAVAVEPYWNPDAGEVEAEGFQSVDAVVHLAGENIAAGRWTQERKESIRKSRVDGTRLLAEALASLPARPRTLVAASAIGFYGNRGDEPVDEDSPPGEGFLAEVCRGWEQAASPAAEAGIRVVNARIGVVLAAQGGALQKLLTPFKLGLGGKVGSGRQYMSWVALDDVIGALHHLLMTESVSGPVNVVAPRAVTSAEFARTLGRVLRRPALLPLPGFAVKAAFGEMGQELLLGGARVIPKRLGESGFRFLHPELEPALRAELGL
jgi:uncharacterized protein (TIGR01777 family)